MPGRGRCSWGGLRGRGTCRGRRGRRGCIIGQCFGIAWRMRLSERNMISPRRRACLGFGPGSRRLGRRRGPMAWRKPTAWQSRRLWTRSPERRATLRGTALPRARTPTTTTDWRERATTRPTGTRTRTGSRPGAIQGRRTFRPNRRCGSSRPGRNGRGGGRVGVRARPRRRIRVGGRLRSHPTPRCASRW
jgi:hypothetical protein